MQALRGIELGAKIQALIVLQVNDAISGAAIEKTESLHTSVRYPGEAEFNPFPAAMRILAGGYFVYIGSALSVFPNGLDPADDVEFQFDVFATGYGNFQSIIVVNAAAVIPVSTTVISLQHSVEAMLVDAPVIQQSISLQPNPIGLQGSVIDDNDFSNPISGVSIRVITPVNEPAVISDAQGRYRIDTLPVASSVTLEIDHLGDVTTVQHLVDFATPLNTRIISLNG
ncbi:MAG: hypothetical protein ACJA0I_001729 [Gammaproteobacteria bacterium]|jgi:hypothetical protein